MPTKLAAIATIEAIVAAFGGYHVLAQTPSSQSSGSWELAVAERGASAFKINTRTGEMFFCHRHNCFKSVEAQAPTNLR